MMILFSKNPTSNGKVGFRHDHIEYHPKRVLNRRTEYQTITENTEIFSNLFADGKLRRKMGELEKKYSKI